MAYLSFADLISLVPGPARLSPAEAAALTLAVARKLDEEGGAEHDPRLPHDQGILLSSTGAIAFVRGPESSGLDNNTALSGLLMRLLRLDAEGPRAHVPGGLLIVLARNLGYIQLPPTSAEAFRAALERFATPDPTLLAGIFWRAARVKGAAPRSGVPGSGIPVPGATATRARPARDERSRADRRHDGPTRADLRRALRDVERELFDTRNRLVRRAAVGRGKGGDVPSRQRPSLRNLVRWTGLAAGVVLVASMATGSGTKSARRAAEPWTPLMGAEVVPAVASEPPLAAQPFAPASDATPDAVTSPPERGSGDAVRRTAAGRPVPATKARPARPARRPAAPPDARHFAGGARQIGWTLQR